MNWFKKYTNRSGIEWWIFATAGIGALIITMLTVSFQAIRSAKFNPVSSLGSE